MLTHPRGLILAGVVLLAEIGVLAWVFSLDGLPEPTDLSQTPGALDALVIEIDPRSLVPDGTTGDAGALYRRVVELYVRDPSDYDRFTRGADLADVGRLAALPLLLEAADQRHAGTFVAQPGAAIGYAHPKPALEALQKVADAAFHHATLVRLSRPEESRAYYRAIFALGAAMFEERLGHEQFLLGTRLLQLGATGLAEAAGREGNVARQAELRVLQDGLTATYRDRIQPLYIKLWSPAGSPTTMGEYAGDRFVFARQSKERMWRVESILAMGRMRFSSGHGSTLAGQKSAERIVREIAETDPDPVIRHAAELARDMTEADWNRVKH